MKTQFLPPERESRETVVQQYELIEKEIDKTYFLNAVPVIYLVLNNKRQIIWANKFVIDFVGKSTVDEIIGLRPGELFNCVHAFETEGGCGTTEFCKTCGAAIAINSGINGKIDYQECRIEQRKSNDALDLKVNSTSIVINNQNYVIFVIIDISHENRRKALERIFFHDIANTIGNLSGYLRLLAPDNKEQFNFDKQILISLTDDLIDEINAQKILINAESNQLNIENAKLNSKIILQDLIQKFKRHYISEGKFIELDQNCEGVSFHSDPTLIKRVIGNMIKNAIEASEIGKKITTGCEKDANSVILWVHNDSFIPRNIQLQLFQRSFSTKGVGRGLGTYSMKLLGEKYLNGKVTFTSSEIEGTKFIFTLPLNG